MIRWHILRTLLHKEMLRHLADRGGLLLSLLLVCMALLLSLGKTSQQAGPLTPALSRVYVAYAKDDPEAVRLRAWQASLKEQMPAELKDALRFPTSDELNHDESGIISVEPGRGLIKISSAPDSTPEKPRFKAEVWYPGDDDGLMAPFEAWFWRSSSRYFAGDGAIAEERHRLKNSADTRSQVAASLVLFSLFFTCVYLLPSLTCEERERGVLLAQALSPASPLEILAAKFLFYPMIGILLGGLIGAIYQPSAVLKPFFWLALLVTALGSLGIGLSIASLARTQRLASLGALCYMLVVALFLFICQQIGEGVLPWVALEYHAPRMIHAALAEDHGRWISLAGATVLACGWASLAVVLFRKRGWQ